MGQGPDKFFFTSPKAVLTLTGRDIPPGAEDLPLEAALTVTCPSLGGLRDLRATAQGPLVLEKSGQLKGNGPAKLEATALWRDALAGGHDLKVRLAGPLSLDLADGGFSAGELRFDLGALSGTAKVWRKSGDGAPTAFSLNTGPEVPRQVLASWGVTLPKELSANQLAKGSLTLSGTAGGAGMTFDRLRLAMREAFGVGHRV